MKPAFGLLRKSVTQLQFKTTSNKGLLGHVYLFSSKCITAESNNNYRQIYRKKTVNSGHCCPDLLFRPSWGGRNYILKWVFFVPWIFAARYIHRRELRLVSLESSSSVEYGIKKIFFFVFYRELSRFKVLRKEEWFHVVFIHIFRNFCLNFRQFC